MHLSQLAIVNMQRAYGRYPSFVDALRDLDDPLTLVHLFATLPAEDAHKIPAKAVATSRRLVLEWQAWVVRTAALRRTFVSVKGFYFQADVMGQPVTWLVPHATSQVSEHNGSPHNVLSLVLSSVIAFPGNEAHLSAWLARAASHLPDAPANVKARPCWQIFER